MNWKKNIRLFLSAQTISLFGSSIVQYAIIWHIALLSSSGWMMSIATLCGYVPQVLVSLFAGVWIDRYNKKKLIMYSDMMIATATFLTACVYLFGVQHFAILFLLLIIRSFGTGIQTPCVNAILPDLLPEEELLHYNGINATLSSVTMFASPVCSGILYSLAPLGYLFFIDVITAVIGVLLTNLLPYHHQRKEKMERFSLEIKEGLAYICNTKTMKYLFLFLFVVMFLISPAAFLTPLLIERTFGNDIWRLPLSETMFSLGAVIGGILIAKMRNQTEKRTFLYATFFYGTMMLGIGLSPVFTCYLLFNFLIGISMPCFNAPLNAILQKESDASMLGRVFSILQIISALSLPLGTLVFGPLADYFPVQLAFVGCGILVMLSAVLYWKVVSKKINL